MPHSDDEGAVLLNRRVPSRVNLILDSLNAPFWGQKGAFKAQNWPIYKAIMNDTNSLSWSDPDSIRCDPTPVRRHLFVIDPAELYPLYVTLPY